MEGTGTPQSLGPLVDPSPTGVPDEAAAIPPAEHAAVGDVEEGHDGAASDVVLVEHPTQQQAQQAGDLGTAAIDEEEGEVEEQFPASRDIPSGGVRPPESIIDLSEWRCHILHAERLIPLDQLCFDKSADHGQVRPLRMEIVKYYLQRLISTGEPVRPMEVMTKQTSGVYIPVT